VSAPARWRGAKGQTSGKVLFLLRDLAAGLRAQAPGSDAIRAPAELIVMQVTCHAPSQPIYG
jgi:hypothetical protein